VSDRHRLDLWLKLVCVYKHRAEATEACASGHVKLNGVRAKASSAVKEGDLIEITDTRIRKLVVLGLPEHSISKEIARTMYRDESPPPPPPEPRVFDRDRGMGRPTKKERRDIDKYFSDRPRRRKG
jgi:ribosome-associated heat shock protein Hsp15